MINLLINFFNQLSTTWTLCSLRFLININDKSEFLLLVISISLFFAPLFLSIFIEEMWDHQFDKS